MRLGWVIAILIAACACTKEEPSKPPPPSDPPTPAGPRLVSGGVELGLETVTVTVSGTWTIEPRGEEWAVRPVSDEGAWLRVLAARDVEKADDLLAPLVGSARVEWAYAEGIANGKTLVDQRAYLGLVRGNRGEVVIIEIVDPERALPFGQRVTAAFTAAKPRAVTTPAPRSGDCRDYQCEMTWSCTCSGGPCTLGYSTAGASNSNRVRACSVFEAQNNYPRVGMYCGATDYAPSGTSVICR